MIRFVSPGNTDDILEYTIDLCRQFEDYKNSQALKDIFTLLHTDAKNIDRDYNRRNILKR